MTPAEEYLRKVHAHTLPTVGHVEVVHLMNNFAYETLKNLYNSLGKEHSTDTILETIANYKAKFHHCAP